MSDIEVLHLSEHNASRRLTLRALAHELGDDYAVPCEVISEIERQISTGKGWWAGWLGDQRANIVRADKVSPLFLPTADPLLSQLSAALAGSEG